MEEQKEVTKLDRVKDHVARHKVIYCIAGGAFVMGVGVLVGAKIGKTEIAVSPVISPTFNNENVLNNTISMGGRMRKIVQNLETGEIFASVTDAAEAAGVNRVIMSKHLNGHLDSINGTLFRIIGLSSE